MTVSACVAESLLVHKLRGFVEDQRAKVQSVTESEIRFRLGSAGLTGRWGRRRDDCPVEVRVRVGSDRGAGGPAGRSEVTIRVDPLGWGVKRAAFDERAAGVVRDLRGYLAAG